MKKCEIVRELQKCDRETSEQMLKKWRQQSCSMQDCHKLPKAVSVKCSKMRYACTLYAEVTGLFRKLAL